MSDMSDLFATGGARFVADFPADTDSNGNGKVDSNVDKPPRRTRTKKSQAPTEHHSIIDTPVEMPEMKRKPRNTELRKALQDSYTMLGMGLFPFDPQTGTVIVEQAETCASSLDELAQKNPAVRKALESLMQTSAWGAVIAAHLPIAVVIGTKYVPQLREMYSSRVAQHEDGRPTP